MSTIEIALLISFVILVVIVKWVNIYFFNPWEQVSKMGSMKFWWIFGYEQWGELKPYQMTKNEIVYKPLIFGLWIREKVR